VKPLGLARVERLIRDLIAHAGVTARLLTVRHEPPRWLILIPGDHDRVFDIRLPDTLTVLELRTRIEQYVLAHAWPEERGTGEPRSDKPWRLREARMTRSDGMLDR
jgi:hypothetical protein